MKPSSGIGGEGTTRSPHGTFQKQPQLPLPQPHQPQPLKPKSQQSHPQKWSLLGALRKKIAGKHRSAHGQATTSSNSMGPADYLSSTKEIRSTEQLSATARQDGQVIVAVTDADDLGDGINMGSAESVNSSMKHMRSLVYNEDEEEGRGESAIATPILTAERLQLLPVIPAGTARTAPAISSPTTTSPTTALSMENTMEPISPAHSLAEKSFWATVGSGSTSSATGAKLTPDDVAPFCLQATRVLIQEHVRYGPEIYKAQDQSGEFMTSIIANMVCQAVQDDLLQESIASDGELHHKQADSSLSETDKESGGQAEAESREQAQQQQQKQQQQEKQEQQPESDEDLLEMELEYTEGDLMARIREKLDACVDQCLQEKASNVESALCNGGPYGAASVCGLRESNEDCFTAVPFLNALAGKSRESKNAISFYAVYDGHGGSACADFVASRLHVHVAQHPHLQGDTLVVRDILRSAFAKTQENWVQYRNQHQLSDMLGSTAVVALVYNRRLFVGWVGDSSAMLIQDHGPCTNIVAPHKAIEPTEAARIKRLGGFVRNGRVNGQLAVTRSFGDVKYGCVLPEPEIKDFPLTGKESYLLLSCDGLTDFLTPQDLRAAIQRLASEHGDDVDSISAGLAKLALENGSTDNITLLLVPLHQGSKYRFITNDLPDERTDLMEANSFLRLLGGSSSSPESRTVSEATIFAKEVSTGDLSNNSSNSYSGPGHTIGSNDPPSPQPPPTATPIIDSVGGGSGSGSSTGGTGGHASEGMTSSTPLQDSRKAFSVSVDSFRVHTVQREHSSSASSAGAATAETAPTKPPVRIEDLRAAYPDLPLSLSEESLLKITADLEANNRQLLELSSAYGRRSSQPQQPQQQPPSPLAMEKHPAAAFVPNRSMSLMGLSSMEETVAITKAMTAATAAASAGAAAATTATPIIAVPNNPSGPSSLPGGITSTSTNTSTTVPSYATSNSSHLGQVYALATSQRQRSATTSFGGSRPRPQAIVNNAVSSVPRSNSNGSLAFTTAAAGGVGVATTTTNTSTTTSNNNGGGGGGTGSRFNLYGDSSLTTTANNGGATSNNNNRGQQQQQSPNTATLPRTRASISMRSPEAEIAALLNISRSIAAAKQPSPS